MRIGMMVDTYKPHISGITNYIASNKREMEQAGHEVYVFTFSDEDYEDDETNIIRSKGVPLVDTGYYVNIGYKRQAQKLLHSMDIVHVHHPFLSGTIALRMCRPRGIPIVFTNHTRYDLYAQAYLPFVPDVIGETMLHAYMPAFCRACDQVIAPSAGMRDILLRFGVDTPIRVVPNGVDIKPFLSCEEILDRQQFGIGQEDVVLIYVGRLGPEKNIPFLLRAFAGMSQAYERTRLLLVGDGPERDNLEDRATTMGIQDKVVFTGMVAYDKLPCYLRICDAFVTASVTEVHPLSVIEAMAAGLPVLGIKSPGVGDTVEEGVSGFLSTEDLAAFTAKMVRLVSGHDLRREMGQNAQKASEQYAIEKTVRTMLDLYAETIVKAKTRKRPLSSKISQFLEDLFK
jgi:1,2-diacylglycerol 3-alpha-glucosyltransferase